jgi:hypothetical protein
MKERDWKILVDVEIWILRRPSNMIVYRSGDSVTCQKNPLFHLTLNTGNDHPSMSLAQLLFPVTTI